MSSQVSIQLGFGSRVLNLPSLKAKSDRSDVTRGHKNSLWMGFSARLADRRQCADLGVTHIAADAGMSKSLVSFLEDGKHVPRLDTAEALATALGLSPTWLIYGPEGHLRFRQRRPRQPLPPDPPEANLAERQSAGLHKLVGERLRSARHTARLSLRAIARAAELSPQGVLLVEQGKTVPLVSTVEQIAVALDVAPGWLAFGEGEGPAESA